MKTSQFNYQLPIRLIAQTPVEPRDHSRLMVVDRKSEKITHSFFYEIRNFLRPGDLLVVNRTRVIPARIFARKPTGGKVEILLLRKESERTWEALIGGKKVKMDVDLSIFDDLHAQLVEDLGSSRRLVEFNRPIEEILPNIGQMPIPPYIHKKLDDPERYQTIYGDRMGSAAAPTAGLHFTRELIDNLLAAGIEIAELTLHVGLDTFSPVTEELAEDHQIHREWCELDMPTAEKINQAHREKRRVIAVGTTTVRTLESAICQDDTDKIVKEFSGFTNLYILPGYSFVVVDAMITNFHLPKSTLLMMVSAFAGWDKIAKWYELAVQENYRFYSFGDAMFIQ